MISGVFGILNGGSEDSRRSEVQSSVPQTSLPMKEPGSTNLRCAQQASATAASRGSAASMRSSRATVQYTSVPGRVAPRFWPEAASDSPTRHKQSQLAHGPVYAFGVDLREGAELLEPNLPCCQNIRLCKGLNHVF